MHLLLLRTLRFTLLFTLCAGCLFFCTSKGVRYQNEAAKQELPYKSSESTAGNHVGRLAANLALEQIGAPYRYGGSSPSGFDCSGLVRYVYEKLGITLPRKAKRMARVGRGIPVDSLNAGDLVFFRIKGQHISHVGIYLSGGEFVHATKTGDPVRTDTLANPWWRKRFVVAKRVYQ